MSLTVYSGHRQGCPTIRTTALATTAKALAAVAGRAGMAITLQIARTAWLVFGSQTDLDRWSLADMLHASPAMFSLPLGIIVELEAEDREQLAAPSASVAELDAAVRAANAAVRPRFATPPRCQWTHADGRRCLLNVHDDDAPHQWGEV